MTFDEWFNANREELEKMLNSDNYELLFNELLFMAWQAGYGAGLDEMRQFAKELWPLK